MRTETERRQGFDRDAGLDAKERGIKQVDMNNEQWREAAYEILLKVADRGIEFTADDVKVQAMQDGLPEPNHPNAWGALYNTAAKRRVIVKTGEYRQSRWARNHAHPYPVWRKANP